METHESLSTMPIVLPAITLEVGKRYFDGRGRVRGPVDESKNGTYVVIDEYGTNFFDASGRSGVGPELNLVAEVPGINVQTPLNLEVGERYKDRSGCVIEITGPWNGAVFKFVGRQITPVFEAGPNEFRFRPDGGFIAEGCSDFDLVALATEEVAS